MWSSVLPFSGVYLFPTEDVAFQALEYFPSLIQLSSIRDPNFIAVNDNGYVQFQVCYQVLYS